MLKVHFWCLCKCCPNSAFVVVVVVVVVVLVVLVQLSLYIFSAKSDNERLLIKVIILATFEARA